MRIIKKYMLQMWAFKAHIITTIEIDGVQRGARARVSWQRWGGGAAALGPGTLRKAPHPVTLVALAINPVKCVRLISNPVVQSRHND